MCTTSRSPRRRRIIAPTDADRGSGTARAHRDRILILDFGSQYTQLIARRIRETGVYSEIHPYDCADEVLPAFAPRGIVLSGGPESVALAPQIAAPAWVFDLGVSVLGICYGMQTMAQQLGGRVESMRAREFGYAQVRAHGYSALLRDIEDHRSPEGHGAAIVRWAWIVKHGENIPEIDQLLRIMRALR